MDEQDYRLEDDHTRVIKEDEDREITNKEELVDRNQLVRKENRRKKYGGRSSLDNRWKYVIEGRKTNNE